MRLEPLEHRLLLSTAAPDPAAPVDAPPVAEIHSLYPQSPVLPGGTVWLQGMGEDTDDTSEVVQVRVRVADATHLADLEFPGLFVVQFDAPDQPGTHTVTVEVLDGEGTWSAPVAADLEVLDPAASIAGIKWNDLNGNGVRESGEPPIANWEVFLDLNGNSQMDAGEPVETTGSDGGYRFDGLAPGVYEVNEVAGGGWVRTSPGLRPVFFSDFSDAGAPSLDGMQSQPGPVFQQADWEALAPADLPGQAPDGPAAGQGPGSFEGVLLTPLIDLTQATAAALAFDYLLLKDYEYAHEQPGRMVWDAARVQIAVDGGSFEALAGPGDALADARGGWTGARVDLAPYLGHEIQLRFLYESPYGHGGNGGIGFYIDNVTVEAQVPGGTGHRVRVGAGTQARDVDFGNHAMQVTVDADGNTRADALTDAILIGRYLFGMTGPALVEGAMSPDASRTDAADIAAFLEDGLPGDGIPAGSALLDADGDGRADALTDGILIGRYLFGIHGEALVQGAVSPTAGRTDPTEVTGFLDQFRPIHQPVAASASPAAPAPITEADPSLLAQAMAAYARGHATLKFIDLDGVPEPGITTVTIPPWINGPGPSSRLGYR